MHYRKSLPFIFLCFAQLHIRAQSNVPKTQTDTVAPNRANVDYSGIWSWNDYVQIWPYSYDSVINAKEGGISLTCDINAQFVVQGFTHFQGSTDSLVIIKFLYYLKDSKKGGKATTITNTPYFYRYNFRGSNFSFDSLAKQPEQVIARDFNTYQRYFYVQASVFHAHAIIVPRKTIVKGALGFGVINYPFKWRIQPHMNDFSGSFNVGAAVSYTHRHDSANKWSFSHVIGIGISSVTLDVASADRDTASLSQSNTFTALTLSYGIMAQYDKVQIGLFIGWDRISNLNNTTYGWKYQGNPWISLGLGYSIFSNNSTTTTAKTDTQPK